MNNKCPKCGFEYGEFDLYCARCGYKLDGSEKIVNEISEPDLSLNFDKHNNSKQEFFNSNIKFFTTKDENFKKYGRVLNLDATSIIDHLSTQEEKDNIKNATKASYVTDREDLHDFI